MQGEGHVRASDGTALYVETFGVGSPIALCDGLACDGFVWRYFIEAFRNRYRLIHWHYPGHGRSAVPAEASVYEIARLADDQAAVLERFSPDTPAVLVGHSLGVQVALETWRRHPGRVKALVLICGAPGALTDSIEPGSLFSYLLPALYSTETVLPARLWDLFRRVPSQLLARAVMLTQETNIRLIRRPDLDAYFNGLKSTDIRVALRFARAASQYDARPFLPRVSVPVLILGGALDRLTPAHQLASAGAAIPAATIHIAKRGSHALPVEQPDLVNLMVRRFLEERVWPSPSGGRSAWPISDR